MIMIIKKNVTVIPGSSCRGLVRLLDIVAYTNIVYSKVNL